MAVQPSLFVSHGSPMFAVESGATGAILKTAGDQLRPKAVVIMSPHWMAQTPAVMTTHAPATWHDFGGFPPALNQLQYPAPGDPALGLQVIDLLAQSGIAAQADAKRPLDHGAWVPLMHLFPAAHVPVVQVALPARAGPGEVYAMGQALASLRAQGVLIIGSGSMTHNLKEFFNERPSLLDAPAPYVTEFARWVEAAVARRDLPALLNYRTQAPQAVRAHPTDDHFLPLFFALGAGGLGQSADVQVNYLSREVMYGTLAMDAFTLME